MTGWQRVANQREIHVAMNSTLRINPSPNLPLTLSRVLRSGGGQRRGRGRMVQPPVSWCEQPRPLLCQSLSAPLCQLSPVQRRLSPTAAEEWQRRQQTQQFFRRQRPKFRWLASAAESAAAGLATSKGPWAYKRRWQQCRQQTRW